MTTAGSPHPGNAEPQLGSAAAPLGWHSRGSLPHRDDPHVLQAITFRLADSLPQSQLAQLKSGLAALPTTERNAEQRRRIEAWLDAGHGCCALRHPAAARTVQETLLRFDGERYRLLAWCIMPNHVHVLIQPEFPLGRILQSWKSFTGRWAKQRNAELGLGVPKGEPFWMREYWDRYIRDERHRRAAIDYIHQNPVAARLCTRPEDWPWSSAKHVHTATPPPGTPSPSSASASPGPPKTPGPDAA